jgi:hypothetical protein
MGWLSYGYEAGERAESHNAHPPAYRSRDEARTIRKEDSRCGSYFDSFISRSMAA